MNATITKITITTSTEGLNGIPADLYAATAEEIISNYFDGAEVEVEVEDRHLSTEIEIDYTETGKRGEDWMEESLGFEWSTREQVGRLLNNAFDAACSRA